MSDTESQGCVAGYWNSFRKNLRGFSKFLYNSEDGTVMGRDGSSWLRISIFYLGYYAFLAMLMAISITVTLSVLDEYKPYFQTRLQYPGVTILPRTNKFDPASLDIRYTIGKNSTWSAYTKALDDMYKNLNQNVSSPNVQDCGKNKPITDNQVFTGDAQALSCLVQKSDFPSDCQNFPYGYGTMSPCIFIKLNKVINWQPVPFSTLNDKLATAEGSPSGAPTLKEVLNDHRAIIYEKEFTFGHCYPLGMEADKIEERFDSFDYSPKGLSDYYFPYLGNKRQKEYRAPMIGVKMQLKDAIIGEEVKMACKVYARNIIDLARINVGYVEFKIKIDKED